MDKFNSDPQGYIQAQAEMLNALAPADWQPDLSQLDALVGSLQIAGMPQSGLHDVVWQWTGSTYQGKENPIADPALYEVVYGSDGTLSVKADCNRASGTYTYNGGMVGSVRVTMGPADPGRLRPRLPLGGVDQQPHGGAGLPCAARRRSTQAQHARRRTCAELPGQRCGGEVRLTCPMGRLRAAA